MAKRPHRTRGRTDLPPRSVGVGEAAGQALRFGGLTGTQILQAVSLADLPRRVFITGAGFTRAFVPDAPLLVDDFGNFALVEKVSGLPRASELLESERNQHPEGFIDIERLMTRLDELMPYEHSDNVVDEFRFLLSQLKRAFLERLSRVRDGEVRSEDILAFAKHCARTNATPALHSTTTTSLTKPWPLLANGIPIGVMGFSADLRLTPYLPTKTLPELPLSCF